MIIKAMVTLVLGAMLVGCQSGGDLSPVPIPDEEVTAVRKILTEPSGVVGDNPLTDAEFEAACAWLEEHNWASDESVYAPDALIEPIAMIAQIGAYSLVAGLNENKEYEPWARATIAKMTAHWAENAPADTESEAYDEWVSDFMRIRGQAVIQRVCEDG